MTVFYLIAPACRQHSAIEKLCFLFSLGVLVFGEYFTTKKLWLSSGIYHSKRVLSVPNVLGSHHPLGW